MLLNINSLRELSQAALWPLASYSSDNHGQHLNTSWFLELKWETSIEKLVQRQEMEGIVTALKGQTVLAHLKEYPINIRGDRQC